MENKMRELLNFEAIVKWNNNDAYAVSMDYNALFKVDLNSGDCTYICMFDEQINKKRLYTSAHKIGGKIYFVPFSADRIAVYEPESNNLYGIDIDTVDSGKYYFYKRNAKFNSGIIVENNLYMIPCTFPGLIKIDTNIDKVEYLNDWVIDEELDFRTHPILVDNKIYVPCTKGNKLLCFDIGEGKGKIIALQTKQSCWWSMCRMGEGFWLSPRKPGPILFWNCDNGKITEYYKYPNDFKGREFYFSLCFEYKTNICFLPVRSNMGIILNPENGMLEEWKIDYVNSESTVVFLTEFNNLIYLRITDETNSIYICIDTETLETFDYCFEFKNNKSKFVEDLRKKIKVIKESKNMNLMWYLKVI